MIFTEYTLRITTKLSNYHHLEVRLGSQSRLINDLRQISAFEVVRIHPLLSQVYQSGECSELIIRLRRVRSTQGAPRDGGGMVDAPDLKSVGSYPVGVQVPLVL